MSHFHLMFVTLGRRSTKSLVFRNMLTCLRQVVTTSSASCLVVLDRVLRSAARLIGRIPKYASVSAYMRDVLHWLPASQRISYRIAALVWRCLAGCAPSYLSDLCRPVSDLAPPSGSAFLGQGRAPCPPGPFMSQAAPSLFGCWALNLEWASI